MSLKDYYPEVISSLWGAVKSLDGVECLCGVPLVLEIKKEKIKKREATLVALLKHGRGLRCHRKLKIIVKIKEPKI